MTDVRLWVKDIWDVLSTPADTASGVKPGLEHVELWEETRAEKVASPAHTVKSENTGASSRWLIWS